MTSMIPIPGSCKGNMPLLRTSINKYAAMGHKHKTSDFELVIRGLEGLTSLVQASQLPAVSRSIVEEYGPYGVDFRSQGKFSHSGEMPITFVETINADVYRRILKGIKDRCYYAVTLKMACEELPEGVKPLIFNFTNCWINLDGADLNVEDRDTNLKPSGTLIYNGFFPDDMV